VSGQSGKPNQRGGDGIECFKPNIKFIVARSDLMELLEESKEALNEITTFIDMFVIASEHLPIGFRRNNGRGIHALDAVNEASGVKGFVSNDGADILHVVDEIGGFGDVVSLATR